MVKHFTWSRGKVTVTAAMGPFNPPGGDCTITWKTMPCLSTVSKPPRMLEYHLIGLKRLGSSAGCFKMLYFGLNIQKNFEYACSIITSSLFCFY